MAKKNRSTYICQSCGHSAARWFGRCVACGEWNTCVEERPQAPDSRR
ncbi:MAG: DNA repair protein RadA, partial [Gemmatimonadetes bacterium]|nr:DNA repair protein RadA [Gemmatimonadota bacterium]